MKKCAISCYFSFALSYKTGRLNPLCWVTFTPDTCIWCWGHILDRHMLQVCTWQWMSLPCIQQLQYAIPCMKQDGNIWYIDTKYHDISYNTSSHIIPQFCADRPWQFGVSKDVLMGTTTLQWCMTMPLQVDNLLEVALDAGMARPMAIPEYYPQYCDIFFGIAIFDICGHCNIWHFWASQYLIVCKYHNIRYQYDAWHNPCCCSNHIFTSHTEFSPKHPSALCLRSCHAWHSYKRPALYIHGGPPTWALSGTFASY